MRVRILRGMAVALAAAAAMAGCGGPMDESVARSGPEAVADVQASSTEQAAPGFIDSDANRIRRDAFVEGAALFTLYHELGHFVMSEYKILNPGGPPGKEIAADRFAAHVMTPLPMSNPTREMLDPASSAGVPEVLWAIAFFRNFQERMEKSGKPFDMSDEHGLPEQRVRQLLCLVYGADPARWSMQGPFMTNLSEERREFCINDRAENAALWAHYLTDRIASDGDQKVYKAIISYEDAPPDLVDYRQWLMNSGLMEDIGAEIGRLKWADSVSEYTALSSLTNTPLWEIKVIGSACPKNGGHEINAYWSPKRRALVLCYGMVAAYDTFAVDVLGNMPETTQTAPLGR